MEEMLEMITWSQLNVHSKPIILMNTKDYYKPFVNWIQLSVKGKRKKKELKFHGCHINFLYIIYNRAIYSTQKCRYFCPV